MGLRPARRLRPQAARVVGDLQVAVAQQAARLRTALARIEDDLAATGAAVDLAEVREVEQRLRAMSVALRDVQEPAEDEDEVPTPEPGGDEPAAPRRQAGPLAEPQPPVLVGTPPLGPPGPAPLPDPEAPRPLGGPRMPAEPSGRVSGLPPGGAAMPDTEGRRLSDPEAGTADLDATKEAAFAGMPDESTNAAGSSARTSSQQAPTAGARGGRAAKAEGEQRQGRSEPQGRESRGAREGDTDQALRAERSTGETKPQR